MTHRDERTRSLPSAIWWASLALASAALLGLVVANHRPAAAGAPAAAPAPAQAEPVATFAMTYTVHIPVVLTKSYRDIIAFERQLENDNHDLFIMYQDGTRLENLTDYPDADDGAPSWSPDGNFVAFSSGRVGGGLRAIYKIDLRSRQVTQLTDPTAGNYTDTWPAWSPLGDQIAFARATDVNPNAEIWIMDADGTNPQQLTFWDYEDEFPAWSPDGQWIVYATRQFYEGLAYAGRDLWRMRPDGSDQQVVLRTDRPQPPDGDAKDRRDEIYPTWAPDGRIYYTYQYRDFPADKTELLYRVWPDGSGREQVFNDTYDRWIASFAPGGQCFVFYSYMGGADKEVWRWCQGDSSPTNLTDNAGISDEFCAWSPGP